MKKLLLSFFMCMLAIIGVQATEVTLSKDDATGKGTSSTGSEFSIHKAPITFAFNKAYGADESIRSYANSNVTISGDDGTTITKIVITTTGDKNGTWGNNVTTSSTTHTWTGNESSVTLSTSAQARITRIVVTYDSQLGFVPTPSITPGANFSGHMNVELSVSGEYDIYYSENGSEYTLYTKPITVVKTTTIEAYATDDTFESERISATYTRENPIVPEVATLWNMVSNASSLAVGDKIVIVATGSDYALSTTQGDNNRTAVTVTKNGNSVTFGDDVQIITLEKGTVDDTWAFYTGSGYLYAASSEKNYLRTQPTKDANASWQVTIDNDGVASITAQGTNTKNQLKKNSISALFSCYGSGQQDVAIYRQEPLEANIAYGMYYLSLGESDVEGATWYAAHFVNAINGNDTWVYGRRVEDSGRVGVHFGLKDQENTYTHIAFCAMMCDAPVFNEEKGELDDVGSAEKLMNWEFVYAHTDYVTYVPATNPGCVSVYNYNDKVWEEVNPDQATALDRVEAANGIGYAYGVVSAEGAIEVYNVNGAVVARGNNNVDLRGLGRGVYIIRTGNQVRKVVR